MRHLALILLSLALAGCACGTPAPQSRGADFEHVVGAPVSGVCLTLPLIPCRLCLGLDCLPLPPLVSRSVFGTPVEAKRTYADPCGAVTYAEPTPCVYGCPSGSASDADVPDYGLPPAGVLR